MWLASILFYAVRISEYGDLDGLSLEMNSKWIDLAMLIIVPILLLPYLYEFTWACLELA